MATETDMRLRSWLDSNQRDREQMCRAVLAIDEHYTDVRPRHPSGGRDGGRDIEAVFDHARTAYGAVGFMNGANDAAEQKKQIRKKFTDDLTSALAANPELKVFVFFTNIHLAIGEQNEMKQHAKKAGVEHCDILDRERIRIELDSPAGFFIRFQYLSIPLSEAEQASFLSKYGHQIQEVVTSGFQRVEKTLNRLLFLAEANDVLGTLTFRFVLKESYPASAIGHYRAFVFLSLRAVTLDIFAIWFGSSDGADRFRDDMPKDQRDRKLGIANGIGSGQWERHIKIPANYDFDKENDEDGGSDDNQTGSTEDEVDDDANGQDHQEKKRYKAVGWSSSVGMDPVPAVIAQYRHDESMIRFRPRLSLRDLDDCMFLPILSASLAEKLHSFQIFANGYKLADFGPGDFHVDPSSVKNDHPGDFTDEELSDPWVRLRPSSMSSAFRLHFDQTTPRRMYGHEEPTDNPSPSISQ